MSCSCTTCIVYVISSKNASSIIALLTKADAKVRTLFYIFQINPKLFFSNPDFSSSLLRKGELRERKHEHRLHFGKRKGICSITALFLKAGAKVRTLPDNFQIFSEVFSFFFLKENISDETTHLWKKNERILTPFLSECQFNAASVPESGCKSRAFGNMNQIYGKVFYLNS